MEEKIYKIIMALIIGMFISICTGIIGLCVAWHTYLYAPVVETTITGDDNITGTMMDNSNIVEKNK